MAKLPPDFVKAPAVKGPLFDHPFRATGAVIEVPDGKYEIVLRVDESVYGALEAAGSEGGRSVAEVVEQILADWVLTRISGEAAPPTPEPERVIPASGLVAQVVELVKEQLRRILPLEASWRWAADRVRVLRHGPSA